MIKQQTAIQWLIEQIMADKTSAWKKEIEQALEMELKQLEEAYSLGELNAAQYFTDTYQSNQ